MINGLLANIGAICFIVILLALCVAALVTVFILSKREKKLKAGYSQLAEGMTKDEVINLLGKASKDNGQQLTWDFLSLKGKGGRVIISIIIADGKVASFSLVKPVKEKTGADKKRGKEQDMRKIVNVEILGVRTGAETRVLATYNFSIYSLLIKYDDGTQDVIEYPGDSEEFKRLVPYMRSGNVDAK